MDSVTKNFPTVTPTKANISMVYPKVSASITGKMEVTTREILNRVSEVGTDCGK